MVVASTFDDQASVQLSDILQCLFYCWCCSPEILYVLLPPLWKPGMSYLNIPIFVKANIYLLHTETSTSSFSLCSIGLLMVLTAFKTLPTLKHWMRFSVTWSESMRSLRTGPLHVYPLLQTGWHPGETASCSELETNYETQVKVSPNAIAKGSLAYENHWNQ